jgi:hypothetical protein
LASGKFHFANSSRSISRIAVSSSITRIFFPRAFVGIGTVDFRRTQNFCGVAVDMPKITLISAIPPGVLWILQPKKGNEFAPAAVCATLQPAPN